MIELLYLLDEIITIQQELQNVKNEFFIYIHLIYIMKNI